jgi:hypothetical protein
LLAPRLKHDAAQVENHVPSLTGHVRLQVRAGLADVDGLTLRQIVPAIMVLAGRWRCGVAGFLEWAVAAQVRQHARDAKNIDLAWLRRRGMLTPGCYSTLTWSLGGNRIGSITLVAQQDGVRLLYHMKNANGGPC